MTLRFLKRHLAPEMVALGIAEMTLTFLLTLVWFTPNTGNVGADAIHPAVTTALIIGFTGFLIGLYRPQVFVSARGMLRNTAITALVSFPAVWTASKLFGVSHLWPVGYDALRPLKIATIWIVGVIGIRLIFLIANRMELFAHRIAIVDADGGRTAQAFPALGQANLKVSALRPAEVSASSLRTKRITTLIVADDSSDQRLPNTMAEYAANGITVQNQAEFCETRLRRVDPTSLKDDWGSSFKDGYSRHTELLVRFFDILLSVFLLVATIPIMAVIAVLIKFDSPGPILYRQVRAGLAGKPFTLLKFRSMRVDAEASGPTWAQKRDARVTRLGSFMRKVRIDELPQLMNILLGEMSFIGPRPERPHFIEQLSSVIPFYEERARVKPGLTGWAQVNYPYGASVEDARAKLSYDLYYVKNRGLLLDLLILFSTVRVILFQEGAR